MPDIRSIVPKALLPSTVTTRRLINEFCERSGMVYFGFVSQRNDEHHIVRGLTVSTKHTDDHYCIGTYDSYDIVFVERSDSLRSGRKHMWHVMEFDLHTTADLPHIFIGSSKSGHGFHELLKTKYPSLTAARLGVTSQYPAAFTNHFTVYTAPTHAVQVESIITSEIADSIGRHFKGLVLEITDGALYVYSEKSHLSAELLDTMLSNGIWLAQHIDQNSRQQ